MNQKGFIKDIVIIVLGILILGGGYFYFSKKPAYAPAENKGQPQAPLTEKVQLVPDRPNRLILNGPGKYINTSFGYSLEAPNGYTVEYLDAWVGDKYLSNSDSSIQVFKTELKNESEAPALNIEVFKIVENISLQKWIDKHSVEDSVFSTGETYDSENLTYNFPAHKDIRYEIINGHKFLSFDEDEDKAIGFASKYSFIEKGGSIFDISYPLHDDGTFRKVFETIKFTK